MGYQATPNGTTQATHRIGRALVMMGASGIWLSFAALTGFLLPWLLGLGIGEADWPILIFGLAVVVAVPIATWLALRIGGVLATLIFVLVGLAIPLIWVPQVRPEYSDPLKVLTWVVVVGGAMLVLGGGLMLRRPPPAP